MEKIQKMQKTGIIYIIIFIQSVLAITAGILAVCLFSVDKLPNGIKIGEEDLGGIGRKEAINLINRRFEDIIKNGKLIINVKDGNSYNFPYSDFDVVFDAEATINSVPETGLNSVAEALKRTFSMQKVVLSPVVSFNESKLRKILIGIASETDKKPVNAVLAYENGKIVKKPEQDGQKLNISKTVEMIREHISSDASSAFVLNRYKNTGLETVQPERKLRDLEEIDTIISQYSTELIYPEFKDAIKHASDVINGMVISAAGDKNSQTSAFSFVKRLEESESGFENDNEGYDQVASTLYAAILKAGIEKSKITRLAHKIPPEYIDPGLDAWISGNGGELKFVNTLPHKIAIFACIEEEHLIIRVAGNTGDKKADIALKVEIAERFSPPVLNIENKDLKKGEKIVLDPGRDSIKVNVYRGTEFIGTDSYEAVKKVIQIGPGTDWSNIGDRK